MNHFKKFPIYLSILLIAIPLLAKPSDKAPTGFMLVKYGTEEPRFFDEFISNQVVLISFWATYCEPCKKEIPEVISLVAKYPQIRVYFINIDPKSESAKVKEMITSFGIEKTSLLDIYHVGADAYIKPKLAVPASFLIDNKGKIVFESVSYEEDTLEKIEKAVKKLK